MPTITIFAKATVEQAMDALAASAKRHGFEIDDESDTRLALRQGTALMSFLFGIFVKYLKADARVKEDDEGEVKVTLEWDNPWWRGIFGPAQNASTMKVFANLFEEKLEDDGGEVLERKGG